MAVHKIILDRIKYKTIEHLLDDNNFIENKCDDKIIFLDLYEAGMYYPYSSTKDWRFNSIYFILKRLHPDNIKNTWFMNCDLRLYENYQHIKQIMIKNNEYKFDSDLNLKIYPWYSVCRGFHKGYQNHNYKINYEKYGILYNVIFLCGEQRLNRLLLLNEFHDNDLFIYSNRNPKVSRPKKHNLNYYDDDTFILDDELITTPDLNSPSLYFETKYWSSLDKKELTDSKNTNILGDVPLEYFYSAVELVGESYTSKGCCFSEKLLKPLFYMKPFIAMAGKNYHNYLREYGFKLYENIFDYSFDNLDFRHRYESIVKQIRQILSMGKNELNKKIDNELDNMEHNRNLIMDIISKNLYCLDMENINDD